MQEHTGLQVGGKGNSPTESILSLTLFIFTVHGDNKMQILLLFIIVFKLLFKIIVSYYPRLTRPLTAYTQGRHLLLLCPPAVCR